MIRIMACGSTTPKDIELLTGAGVDGIGLITEVAQNIDCNLSREQAHRLASRIPPLVASVLILTETRVKEICELVELIRPDVLQLHGDVTPQSLRFLKERLPVKIVNALLVPTKPVPTAYLISQVQTYLDHGSDAILIDSGAGGKYGSIGQVVDMQLAHRVRDAAFPRPFILAGGLNSDNVASAIKEVQPYAVDVFSGIREAGRLSGRELMEFIRVVRAVNLEELSSNEG